MDQNIHFKWDSVKSFTMKAASLIPFVVGLFNLESCVKNSSEIWKYGPEYTFQMGINFSLTPSSKTSSRIGYNAAITLKCRPFSSETGVQRDDSLQCYIHESRVRDYKQNMTVLPPQIVENKIQGPFQIVSQKFEIIYDKKGISVLRVEPTVSATQINMIRSMASHLNFGFDRFDKGGERFAVVAVDGHENSTIGECKTKFEVSKQMTNQGKRWNSSCGEEIYLETYAYGSKNPMIAMDKARDTKKCFKSTPYFFGIDEIITGEVPTALNTEMISSVTSFFVGPQNFQSHSKSQATILYKNETNMGDEEIDLVLQSIEAAKNEFKTIPSPCFTTIFAYDNVNKTQKAS